jgi:hypothetical protein
MAGPVRTVLHVNQSAGVDLVFYLPLCLSLFLSLPPLLSSRCLLWEGVWLRLLLFLTLIISSRLLDFSNSQSLDLSTFQSTNLSTS